MHTAYDWLNREFTDDADETWLFVAFIGDLPPLEALRRLGASPDKPLDSDAGIAAYSTPGGCVLVESGWAGIVFDRADALSPGTSVAAVQATNQSESFALHTDGRLITRFDLGSYADRSGDDPDRLHSQVEELGLDFDLEVTAFPEGHIGRALTLAARATGVSFTLAHYSGPALIASVDHLEPYA